MGVSEYFAIAAAAAAGLAVARGASSLITHLAASRLEEEWSCSDSSSRNDSNETRSLPTQPSKGKGLESLQTPIQN
jgi:hypothetical protein